MRKLAHLAITAVFLAHAAAAAVYDEAVDGDLSGNRLEPTSLGQLANGLTSVLGTTTAGDLDYLTFTVPVGATLTAITLADYVSTNELGFMAIQAGATLTEPAGARTPLTCSATPTSALGSAGRMSGRTRSCP